MTKGTSDPTPRVAVIMGSKSDWTTMQRAAETLAEHSDVITLEQRRFLEAQGVPQARIAPVSDAESLRAAASVVGFPCVLKTRRSGYDGRGPPRQRDRAAHAQQWALHLRLGGSRGGRR